MFKDQEQAKTWSDDKPILFADLKLIEQQCKQRISTHQLVENMTEFKEKMFPGSSNKAALEAVDNNFLKPVLKEVYLGEYAKSTYNNQVVFRHRDYSPYKRFWNKANAVSYMHEIASAISADLIEQPYADFPENKITNGIQVAYHQNHGTGHSIRKRQLAIHYLHLVQELGQSPHKEAAQSLTKEELACLELAVYMQRIGRTNEHASIKDKTNIKRSAILFESVAKQLGFNETLFQSMAYLIINPISVDELKKGGVDLKELGKGFAAKVGGSSEQKAVIMMRIMDLTHHTDLIRCWSGDASSFRNPIEQQLNYLLEDKSKVDKCTEMMIDYAIDLCKTTGAKVTLKGKPYNEMNHNQVAKVANNPKGAMQELSQLDGAKADFKESEGLHHHGVFALKSSDIAKQPQKPDLDPAVAVKKK